MFVACLIGGIFFVFVLWFTTYSLFNIVDWIYNNISEHLASIFMIVAFGIIIGLLFYTSLIIE